MHKFSCFRTAILGKTGNDMPVNQLVTSNVLVVLKSSPFNDMPSTTILYLPGVSGVVKTNFSELFCLIVIPGFHKIVFLVSGCSAKLSCNLSLQFVSARN